MRESRRSLMAWAGARAAALALATPALAEPGEADPHPAWWREVLALDARDGIDTGRTEEEIDAECERLHELARLIAGTSARTYTGARVQIEAVMRALDLWDDASTERPGLDRALATLDRLLGRA